MSKKIILLVLCLAVAGCSAWTNHHDEVDWGNGMVTKMTVSSDGVLTAKNGDMEVSADHRGRASVVEQILGIGASAVSDGLQVEVGD